MDNINNIPESELKEIHDNILSESVEFNGATILLLGASGFLGSYFKAFFLYLNKYVLNKPCFIICVDNYIGRNKPKEIEDNNLLNLDHDLITPLGLKLADYKISHIINTSGCASPALYARFPLETMRVSTIAVDHLLELAFQHKAKILNFSSSEVLQDPDEIPTTENQIPKVHSTNIRSPYDTTKVYLETSSWVFKTKYKVDAKVVRLFNCIGRMRQDDFRVFPNFISSILKGEKINVFSPGTQTRTFAWVSDVISGCLKVLVNGRDLIYHIGNPDSEISMVDLAYLMEKICGKSGLVNVIPTNDIYKHEPQRRCPSIEKARKELNYHPKVGLEEMIKRFYKFAQENYKF